MAKEIDREKLRFATDEGQIVYFKMDYPTQPDTYGNWSYKIELAWDVEQKNAMFKGALANLYEAVTDKRAIPKGLIKKAEDTDKSDAGKALIGDRVFSSFSKKCNPKERNLGDPAERKAWIEYLKTQQPKLFKLNDKGERVEVRDHNEIYSGCYAKVVGHCFYNNEYKKYCITVDYVILTKKGERIGGGPINPDDDQLLNSLAPKAKDEVDQVLNEASGEEFEELPF